MKTIILFLMLLFLTACGRDTPIVDGHTPFIVGKIKSQFSGYDKCKDLCMYISEEQLNMGYDSGLFSSWAAIIAPCGLYQIGDTITLR
jgi:hypothetical protein